MAFNIYLRFSETNLSIYPIWVGIMFLGRLSKSKNFNSMLSLSGFKSPNEIKVIPKEDIVFAQNEEWKNE